MSIYRRGKNWYIDFTFKGKRIQRKISPLSKRMEKEIIKGKEEIAGIRRMLRELKKKISK
jgi:DNA-binding MarR family transcriptional regulator